MHGVFEWPVAFRHCVLADENEQACARIERRSPAHSRDREVEPEFCEILIEAVALVEASLERARLQFEAGVNRGVAVFRAQIRIGHHERPLVS